MTFEFSLIAPCSARLKRVMRWRTLVPAAALVALSACGGPGEEIDAAPGEKKIAEIPVHTSTIETADFVDTIKVYGRVEANESLTVQTQMMGRIESLPFDDGDKVKKGQTLMRINARQAYAQKKQADAQLHQAQTELARTEKLVAKKLATAQQLDGQRAQVEIAQAASDMAGVIVSHAVIRSPIAGQVTNMSTSIGSLASPGMNLFSVVDIDTVEVVADVPEKDIALIETGAAVDVHVEAHGDAIFKGTIETVGLMANSATRTFPVKIRIKNADHRLRPGMLCWLDLSRQSFTGAVVIPRDAVIDDVNQKTVYLNKNGSAQQRIVELGPARGRFVVVRSGVKANDELVVLGHRQLVDGQKMSIKSSTPCCAAQLRGKAPGTPDIESTAPDAASDENANGEKP